MERPTRLERKDPIQTIETYKNLFFAHFKSLGFEEHPPIRVIRDSASKTYFTSAAVQIWESDLLQKRFEKNSPKYYICQRVFRTHITTDASQNSFSSFHNVATCFYIEDIEDFKENIRQWLRLITSLIRPDQSIRTEVKKMKGDTNWHNCNSLDVMVYIVQNDTFEEIEVGHCSAIILGMNKVFVDSGFGLERIFYAINPRHKNEEVQKHLDRYRTSESLVNSALVLLSENVLEARQDRVSYFKKIIIAVLKFNYENYDLMFRELRIYRKNLNYKTLIKYFIRAIIYKLIILNNEDESFNNISTTKKWEQLSPKLFFFKFGNAEFFEQHLQKSNISINSLESLWQEIETIETIK